MKWKDIVQSLEASLNAIEDVSDVVFRRLCRKHGAEICLTEFVNVEGLLRGFRQDGAFIDIGTPESYARAEAFLGCVAVR